jgi:hypothetical protein
MSKITNDTFAKHMRLFKQRLNENKITNEEMDWPKMDDSHVGPDMEQHPEVPDDLNYGSNVINDPDFNPENPEFKYFIDNRKLVSASYKGKRLTQDELNWFQGEYPDFVQNHLKDF